MCLAVQNNCFSGMTTDSESSETASGPSLLCLISYTQQSRTVHCKEKFVILEFFIHRKKINNHSIFFLLVILLLW